MRAGALAALCLLPVAALGDESMGFVPDLPFEIVDPADPPERTRLRQHGVTYICETRGTAPALEVGDCAPAAAFRDPDAGPSDEERISFQAFVTRLEARGTGAIEPALREAVVAEGCLDIATDEEMLSLTHRILVRLADRFDLPAPTEKAVRAHPGATPALDAAFGALRRDGLIVPLGGGIRVNPARC